MSNVKINYVKKNEIVEELKLTVDQKIIQFSAKSKDTLNALQFQKEKWETVRDQLNKKLKNCMIDLVRDGDIEDFSEEEINDPENESAMPYYRLSFKEGNFCLFHQVENEFDLELDFYNIVLEHFQNNDRYTVTRFFPDMDARDNKSNDQLYEKIDTEKAEERELVLIRASEPNVTKSYANEEREEDDFAMFELKKDLEEAVPGTSEMRAIYDFNNKELILESKPSQLAQYDSAITMEQLIKALKGMPDIEGYNEWVIDEEIDHNKQKTGVYTMTLNYKGLMKIQTCVWKVMSKFKKIAEIVAPRSTKEGKKPNSNAYRVWFTKYSQVVNIVKLADLEPKRMPEGVYHENHNLTPKNEQINEDFSALKAIENASTTDARL